MAVAIETGGATIYAPEVIDLALVPVMIAAVAVWAVAVDFSFNIFCNPDMAASPSVVAVAVAAGMPRPRPRACANSDDSCAAIEAGDNVDVVIFAKVGPKAGDADAEDSEADVDDGSEVMCIISIWTGFEMGMVEEWIEGEPLTVDCVRSFSAKFTTGAD